MDSKVGMLGSNIGRFEALSLDGYEGRPWDGFELDGVEPDGFECGMTVLWIRTRYLPGWIRSTAKLLGFGLG